MKFKNVIMSLLVVAATITQLSIAAEKWPSKPIQLIVPIDTGTTKDAVARHLANELSLRWNQPVTVVNQSGGAGALGHQTMANSLPDGSTIGFISASLTGSLATRKNLPFTRDKIIGVSKFGVQDFVLFVNKDAPYNNFQEMISYARSNPGQLTYATPGIGSYAHITMEHLAHVENLKFTHVAYKAFMQSVPDVSSGRVQMVVTVANSALDGQVAKGDMKVFGSLTKNSMYQGKTIQSVNSIVSDVGASGFYGIVVAKGTPKHIINQLASDISAVVSSQEFKKFMISKGIRPDTSKPLNSEEFTIWIDSEIIKLQKIITASKMSLE